MCPSPKNFHWVVEEPLQVPTTSLEALPRQLTRDREGEGVLPTEAWIIPTVPSCYLKLPLLLLFISKQLLEMQNAYNHPLTVLVVE